MDNSIAYRAPKAAKLSKCPTGLFQKQGKSETNDADGDNPTAG